MGDPTVFYNFHSALPCSGQRFWGGWELQAFAKGSFCTQNFWVLVLPWNRKGFWFLLKLLQPPQLFGASTGVQSEWKMIEFTSCWSKVNLFRAALELAGGASRGVGLGQGGLLALRAPAQLSWLSRCPSWDISWPQTSFAQALAPVGSPEQLHRYPG